MAETNSSLIDAAERMRIGLLAIATNGDYSNVDFLNDKNTLMENGMIRELMPSIVRNSRTVQDFQFVMRGQFRTYAERRSHITEILNPVFEYLEHIRNSKNAFSEFFKLSDCELIGNGGFGVVYKYHRQLLDYDFAVKIFSPLFTSNAEAAEAEKRFFREAKLLFALTHENIVRVFDIGYYENNPFILMEYVDGVTLQDFISQHGPVSFSRSLKPITALLQGMRYAHSKGVIHRDLKPSNVMVTHNGCVKIIDFGISAYIETTGHTRLTKTGERVAGGLYTDPCLFDNPSLRDIRSDIYSIGAIWYYLVVGRAPSGSDMQQVLLASTQVTQSEADIILRCMSQQLEQRFSSCKELLLLLTEKDD